MKRIDLVSLITVTIHFLRKGSEKQVKKLFINDILSQKLREIHSMLI